MRGAEGELVFPLCLYFTSLSGRITLLLSLSRRRDSAVKPLKSWVQTEPLFNQTDFYLRVQFRFNSFGFKSAHFALV